MACDPVHSVRSRSPGFTLIELLVTISIIAMLIALLLPALGAARNAAWTTLCQSRMRQMAIAYHTYAADHSDLLPPIEGGRFDDTVPVHAERWHNSILPYLGMGHYNESDMAWPWPIPKISIGMEEYGENVFHCPTLLRQGPIWTPGAGLDDPQYAYGPNLWPLRQISGGSGNSDLDQSLALSELHDASGSVMHGEIGTFHLRPHWYFDRGYMAHNRGTTFVFHDGHVERVQYENVPVEREDTFWTGR